jgi:tetratricopeptide (TPR) repeat protein
MSLLATTGSPASAQDTGSVRPAHAPSDATVHYPVACSPTAQALFDRGLTQLHHMTYPSARGSFEAAARADPACAMAHWGIAMTLFQPLWPSRPDAQALQRGWDASGQARRLVADDRRNEQLLIAAAQAFFQDPADADYWRRIRRWEAASARAYEALPGDDEVAVFHALSLLATAPSDKVSRSHADAAARVLLQVRERQPGHPGVMHYLIHANDTPGREGEQLEVTRLYETTAPANAHALHMPTHIYTRLGDWDGVVRGNLRSAAAALRQPAAGGPDKVSDEYAHAIEYLVYATLQQGDDAAAAGHVRTLQATGRLEPSFKTAFHLASTQARVVLERHDWAQAAALQPRQSTLVDWDKFPWPEAVSQFARGLGGARTGQLVQAQAASQRLATLEQNTRTAGETLFARNIEVLRLGLEAWIAQARGRSTQAVALMRQAAELETSTPKHAVTPGPTLPAWELLGDLLMEQGAHADALKAYRTSLSHYPNRFNSLIGAARASEGVHDRDAARGYYETLLETAPTSTRPAVQEARAYLAAASR